MWSRQVLLSDHPSYVWPFLQRKYIDKYIYFQVVGFSCQFTYQGRTDLNYTAQLAKLISQLDNELSMS